VIVTAVLSQKGGVGKTITVANLAAALAQAGQRVLMVDLDPQADLTAGWGLGDDDERPRIEDVLAGRSGLDEALLTFGDVARLALVPASRQLRTLTDPLLRGDLADLHRLLTGLTGRFDLVMVDTPAGETVFGAQAIRAALARLPRGPRPAPRAG
jgi:chromosome partitioning protein